MPEAGSVIVGNMWQMKRVALQTERISDFGKGGS
jgi:hypothetical protein